MILVLDGFLNYLEKGDVQVITEKINGLVDWVNQQVSEVIEELCSLHFETEIQNIRLSDYIEFFDFLARLIKQETNLTEREIYQQMGETRLNESQPEVIVLSWLLVKLKLAGKFNKSKKGKEWSFLFNKRSLRRIIKNKILRFEYSALQKGKRTRLVQFLVENKIDYRERYVDH